MTSIRLLAACLLLTASPVVARPGPVASVVVPAPVIPTETAADELALGNDYGGRMTVAVEIGGKGPYRFLVDTGSERTVISRQLAERLGLDSLRAQQVMFDFKGKTMSISRASKRP